MTIESSNVRFEKSDVWLTVSAPGFYSFLIFFNPVFTSYFALFFVTHCSHKKNSYSFAESQKAERPASVRVVVHLLEFLTGLNIFISNEEEEEVQRAS